MVMASRIESPMKTWQPCNPVSPKNVAAKDESLVLKPMRWYSMICVSRKVEPSRSVSTMPAFSPARSPRLAERVAQCIVKLEVTRMHVLTRATNHGRSYWVCVPGM